MDREDAIGSLVDQPGIGFLEFSRRGLRGARQILAARQLAVEARVIQLHAIQKRLFAEKYGEGHYGDTKLLRYLRRYVRGTVGDDTNTHKNSSEAIIPPIKYRYSGVAPRL